MWLNSTMPRPKKTLSTAPMAASIGRRVRLTMNWTARTPTMPETAAPARSSQRLRPLWPRATARRKASAMPGRAAWLKASLISARLRSSANVPTVPAAMPSNVTPASTTAVL